MKLIVGSGTGPFNIFINIIDTRLKSALIIKKNNLKITRCGEMSIRPRVKIYGHSEDLWSSQMSTLRGFQAELRHLSIDIANWDREGRRNLKKRAPPCPIRTHGGQ